MWTAHADRDQIATYPATSKINDLGTAVRSGVSGFQEQRIECGLASEGLRRRADPCTIRRGNGSQRTAQGFLLQIMLLIPCWIYFCLSSSIPFQENVHLHQFVKPSAQ